WSRALDSEQPGAAMNDHLGLARSRAGEDQHVAIRRGGDNAALRLVGEIGDDALEGFGAGSVVEKLLLRAEVAPNEIVLRKREVSDDQAEGILHLDDRAPGV